MALREPRQTLHRLRLVSTGGEDRKKQVCRWEPFLGHPIGRVSDLRGYIGVGNFTVFDKRLDGAILKARGKFHILPTNGRKEGLRTFVDGRVIIKVRNAIPVGDNAIDTGEFHLQKLALQDVWISRII